MSTDSGPIQPTNGNYLTGRFCLATTYFLTATKPQTDHQSGYIHTPGTTIFFSPPRLTTTFSVERRQQRAERMSAVLSNPSAAPTEHGSSSTKGAYSGSKEADATAETPATATMMCACRRPAKLFTTKMAANPTPSHPVKRGLGSPA